MKKVNFNKIGLLLIFPFLLFSCEKWIDPDMNIDPNNPSEVSLDLLLPSAIVDMAYQIGGDVSRPCCMWTQQISGISRQSLTFERYVYKDSDVNNMWRFGFYSHTLMNCNLIIDKAGESPHYAGVAKVLTAYTLGIMTDIWGDLPYSDAFQGSANLKPAFDSQQSIYETIQSLLDDAINNDLVAQVSVLSPADNDMIYGGDLSLWIKAAWSIKARYALHLSKINDNQAYQDALTYLANGITDNAEDFEFVFGSNNLEENPAYQFARDRDDIRIGEAIVNGMLASNDPRLPFYATGDTGGAYRGAPPGSGDGTTSGIGPYFASANSPVSMISNMELLYVKAEALLQTGDNAGAITAYNDALEASLNKIGVFDQAWFDTTKFTGATIDLETIMWGKYNALFLSPEIFVDFRRNNMLEDLPDVQAASSTQKPRRFPYPSSEKAYNGANVPSNISLFKRLWWDTE